MQKTSHAFTKKSKNEFNQETRSRKLFNSQEGNILYVFLKINLENSHTDNHHFFDAFPQQLNTHPYKKLVHP